MIEGSVVIEEKKRGDDDAVKYVTILCNTLHETF